MPLYKYVTDSTAVRIFSERTIRFTQPCAFNDPFEFLPQFIRQEENLWHIEGRFTFSLNSPHRKGIEVNDCAELTEANNDEAARFLVEELSKHVGVLCLTKNPNNLLMWAHYCYEHRGAVIEFDEDHPFFSNTFPVLYAEKRPVYNLSDFIEKTVPLSDFYVKSDKWKYEQEVRISKPLHGARKVSSTDGDAPVFVYDLPPECILGVTLGARMSDTKKQEIWSLVKDTHISVEQAIISNWNFALRRESAKPKGKFDGFPTISLATAAIFLKEPAPLGEIARQIHERHPLSAAVRLPTVR